MESKCSRNWNSLSFTTT